MCPACLPCVVLLHAATVLLLKFHLWSLALRRVATYLSAQDDTCNSHVTDVCRTLSCLVSSCCFPQLARLCTRPLMRELLLVHYTTGNLLA